MPTQPVHVVIQADAIPAQADALKTVLRGLADASRREPGCLAYAVLVDNANPARVIITEAWQDAAALAAHRQTPHVAAALSALQGKLAAAPDIRELTSIV